MQFWVPGLSLDRGRKPKSTEKKTPHGNNVQIRTWDTQDDTSLQQTSCNLGTSGRVCIFTLHSGPDNVHFFLKPRTCRRYVHVYYSSLYSEHSIKCFETADSFFLSQLIHSCNLIQPPTPMSVALITSYFKVSGLNNLSCWSCCYGDKIAGIDSTFYWPLSFKGNHRTASDCLNWTNMRWTKWWHFRHLCKTILITGKKKKNS